MNLSRVGRIMETRQEHRKSIPWIFVAVLGGLALAGCNGGPPGSVGGAGGEGGGGAASIERVSVANDGTQGISQSLLAAISGNGRFVVFVSDSSNLVSADTNGVADVFLRDTCAGAAGCIPSTARVSVATDGTQGNAASSIPAISSSGRFTVFVSDSNTLVSADTNGVADVFLRDTCQGAAGCTPSTTRLSVATDGTQGNAASSFPAISADERFVAFASSANTLVASDTNGVVDVFVRDTCFGAAGCTPSTGRVSVASDGTQASGDNSFPRLSGNGRFVVFQSGANNLVSGDSNGTVDIFLRDTCQGAAGCVVSTTRVSVASDGSQAVGVSAFPALSSNGRFIAFTSNAANLVASDTNGVEDVFLRDTCQGAAGCTPSTGRVSVSTSGIQASSGSGFAAISSTGRFVAFESAASELVSGDTNALSDIFVRDTCAGAGGCTPSTIRVSVASNGTQGNGGSIAAAIDDSGGIVCFESTASNLVSNDTNGVRDIFRVTGF